MSHTPTPGQTVGPFFHYALPYDGDRDLVAPGTPGRGPPARHGARRRGRTGPGRARGDLAGRPRRAASSQRSGSLRRDGHTFTGFGRASTDRDGGVHLHHAGARGVDAGLPFFAVTVFARGLLNRLFTRAYLPLADGATDTLLASVPEDRRRDPGVRGGRARLPSSTSG